MRKYVTFFAHTGFSVHDQSGSIPQLEKHKSPACGSFFCVMQKLKYGNMF